MELQDNMENLRKEREKIREVIVTRNAARNGCAKSAPKPRRRSDTWIKYYHKEDRDILLSSADFLSGKNLVINQEVCIILAVSLQTLDR